MTSTASPFASLADLGWDAGWDDAFEQWASLRSDLAALPLAKGRVTRRDKTTCDVAFGGHNSRCRISQRLLRDPGGAPSTGDFVVVAGGEVAGALPRRTSVVRGSARDLSTQVLAANVDHVIVTASLSADLRPRRLERLLVVAWQTGALPIVALTKADCCAEPGAAYERAKSLAPGASVHVVSALSGEGIDALAAELAPGTTAVAIGPSGAGKSTLANALSDGTAGLAIGDVREDGKGRHTTVTCELVRLASGALMIDTPGLRAIGLSDAADALAETFADIEELASQCRFNDCAHGTEPGCAVSEAIAGGTLDRDRLVSYQRLQREQLRLAARTGHRLRIERAAKQRAFYRQARGTPRP